MNVAKLRDILLGGTYGENIALCDIEQVLIEYDAVRTENARLLASLADIAAYGVNGRIHPADRVRAMVQMAQAAAELRS